ncbi:beta-ketoacyl-ACP synthase 3 [Streptomyces sp. NPDC048508]|uniref:beta-ketoacyl-ACP synthase 3 n=1 Tax=Streptomyces sp. NPDC048508 TaxID=3365561 RepID=UPI0037221646
MNGSRISGVGAYRPVTKVDNIEMEKRVGVSPKWIEERTGIIRRGHANDEETIVNMAAWAGLDALKSADVPPEDVDLVLVATSTRRRPMPGAAPEIAHKMGVMAPGAMDVNGVCAGFPYALSFASNAVRMNDARHALVIGVDRLTDWLHPDVKDTYVIFADGAGAVLVSQSGDNQIGSVAWGSDGSRKDAAGIADDAWHVVMNGPLIYRWAVNTIPDLARRACDLADVAIEDISWLVPHQANRRIIDAIGEDLGIPSDRIVRDLTETGNTSAASVPLALDNLKRNPDVQSGDKALLLGFGAGLTYAGQVVHLP